MNLRKVILILTLSWFGQQKIHAQLYQRELSAGIDYMMPIDNWKHSFDSAPMYKISFLLGKKSNSGLKTWVGGSMGYMNQSPAADTIYYYVDASYHGYFVYTDKAFYHLSLKYKWETQGSALKGFGSFEIGFLSVSYDYIEQGSGSRTSADISSVGGFLAPILGVAYTWDEGLGAFIQAKYEFSFANEILNHLAWGGGLTFRF